MISCIISYGGDLCSTFDERRFEIKLNKKSYKDKFRRTFFIINNEIKIGGKEHIKKQ